MSKINIFVIIIAVIISCFSVFSITYLQPKLEKPSADGGISTINIVSEYNLEDIHGKQVTNKSFPDIYQLVYFGYTSCPDICPTSLTIIAEAQKMLASQGKDFKLVFITIDPNRDKGDSFAKYVAEFSENSIALSGSEEQIRQAANNFKVYYAKASDEKNYMMDHTNLFYLLGKNGEFLAAFPGKINSDELAKNISNYIK